MWHYFLPFPVSDTCIGPPLYCDAYRGSWGRDVRGRKQETGFLKWYRARFFLLNSAFCLWPDFHRLVVRATTITEPFRRRHPGHEMPQTQGNWMSSSHTKHLISHLLLKKAFSPSTTDCVIFLSWKIRRQRKPSLECTFLDIFPFFSTISYRPYPNYLNENCHVCRRTSGKPVSQELEVTIRDTVSYF
jgi:hypothetical protein